MASADREYGRTSTPVPAQLCRGISEQVQGWSHRGFCVSLADQVGVSGCRHVLEAVARTKRLPPWLPPKVADSAKASRVFLSISVLNTSKTLKRLREAL